MENVADFNRQQYYLNVCLVLLLCCDVTTISINYFYNDIIHLNGARKKK